MAILAFQKPDKVLMLEADAFFGKFEFRPLEPGYAVTIGNAVSSSTPLKALPLHRFASAVWSTSSRPYPVSSKM